MKIPLKTLRELALVLAFVAPVLLWVTRVEDYPSQSYSAIYSNVFFYYLMHISIQASFALDWMDSHRRTGAWRHYSLVPVLFGVTVVLFDMHEFPVLHNSATALLMASAAFSLIYDAFDQNERIYAIVLACVGVIMFPLGMYSAVSLFWTEVIAEVAIGIGLARRLYLHDYV